MATVSAGHVGLAPTTLTANVALAVAFTDNVGRVEVVSDGVADAWVRIGATDPTIPTAGASTAAYRLPSGVVSSLSLSLLGDVDTVRIISSGTPTVSVQIAS